MRQRATGHDSGERAADERVVVAREGLGQPARAVGLDGHLVALLLEPAPDGLRDVGLVLDEEEACGRRGRRRQGHEPVGSDRKTTGTPRGALCKLRATPTRPMTALVLAALWLALLGGWWTVGCGLRGVSPSTGRTALPATDEPTG